MHLTCTCHAPVERPLHLRPRLRCTSDRPSRRWHAQLHAQSGKKLFCVDRSREIGRLGAPFRPLRPIIPTSFADLAELGACWGMRELGGRGYECGLGERRRCWERLGGLERVDKYLCVFAITLLCDISLIYIPQNFVQKYATMCAELYFTITFFSL